jgi:hypothetical protein
MFSFGHLPDQLLSTGAGPLLGADISEPTTPTDVPPNRKLFQISHNRNPLILLFHFEIECKAVGKENAFRLEAPPSDIDGCFSV